MSSGRNKIKDEEEKSTVYIKHRRAFNELQQLKPLFEKYDYHIVTEKDNSTIGAKEKYGDKISYLPYGTRKKLFRYIFVYFYLCLKTIYLYFEDKATIHSYNRNTYCRTNVLSWKIIWK